MLKILIVLILFLAGCCDYDTCIVVKNTDTMTTKTLCITDSYVYSVGKNMIEIKNRKTGENIFYFPKPGEILVMFHKEKEIPHERK